jgi:hypothetical protein
MLTKIMNMLKPPTPKQTTVDDIQAISICEWYRKILADEETYFKNADNCLAERYRCESRIAVLSGELREKPDVEKWIELAREESLLAGLIECNNPPFLKTRGDRFKNRAGENEGHEENIKLLARWAEAYVETRLAESQESDRKLSQELQARDEIVSGTTRRLLAIAHTLGLLREKLEILDEENGLFWMPFGGLVAHCEEELKGSPAAVSDGFSGSYIYKPTGETYALKIVDKSQVRQGRTHLAKSDSAFWEGTDAEFLRLFNKV